MLKYLGVHFNNKFNFKLKTHCVIAVLHAAIFFKRRLVVKIVSGGGVIGVKSRDFADQIFFWKNAMWRVIFTGSNVDTNFVMSVSSF